VPIVACSSCNAKLNAPDSAIGKKVKCRCGALVDVPPGAAPKASAATPTKTQPANTQASKLQPKASGPSNTMGQLLDQLTASDFSRAEKKVESTGPSQSQRDSKALDAFKDPNAKSGKRGGFNDGRSAAASSSMEDLDAIATVYLVFAGLHSLGLAVGIFSSFLTTGIMAIASLPFLLMLALPTVGYDLAAGYGLKQRKPWGWWLGAIGIGWVVGATLPGVLGLILLIFAIVQGKLEAGDAVSAFVNCGISVMIFIASIWMLRQMINKNIMKKYNVTVAPALAWLACLAGGIVVGIAYIVFLLVYVLGLVSLSTLFNRGQ
jgi:hypothetical protein